MADLTARGYLDDAGYARQWVNARLARGFGATRLRAELRARGVAARVIDEALAGLDSEETLTRAREAARRRLPALRRGRPERVAGRLRDYLLRRGYGRTVVARVVRESLGVVVD